MVLLLLPLWKGKLAHGLNNRIKAFGHDFPFINRSKHCTFQVADLLVITTKKLLLWQLLKM